MTPYPPATLNRAERALRCSALQLALLGTMRSESVPLSAIAAPQAVQQGYVRRPLSEGQAEGELSWLIQVGLLRREVDGQGITDRFRLTPLGRHLVEKWERQGGLPSPSVWEQLLDAWHRWLRLPI